MPTLQDTRDKLNAKIPRDVISLRDSGAGRKLSYLEGWYVIARLNEVLGIGNWAYHSDVNVVHSGNVETRSGTTYSVHYIAKVRLVVELPDGVKTEFTDYGYGDGTDKNNPGKAHELAVKEAVTDGIKRCAKNLGMSLGLALYDKTQENVTDDEEAISPGNNKASNKQYTNGKANTGGVADNKPASLVSPNGGNAAAKKDAPMDNKNAVEHGEKSLEDTQELIKSTVRVVTAKKVKTQEELKQHLLNTYKGNLSALSYPQAKEFLGYLQSLI